jgi:hypothetical protein
MSSLSSFVRFYSLAFGYCVQMSFLFGSRQRLELILLGAREAPVSSYSDDGDYDTGNKDGKYEIAIQKCSILFTPVIAGYW